MEALRKVQLVGKVARCLQENWGVEDKTLAEFVIDLCKKSGVTSQLHHRDMQRDINSPTVVSVAAKIPKSEIIFCRETSLLF